MTSCMLDYNHFNKYYEMLAIDSSKQQALPTDLKVIHEIYFTENLNGGEVVNDNTIMFFIIEEAKETVSDFSPVTVKVL